MNRYYRDKQIASKRYKEYLNREREYLLLLGGQKDVKFIFVGQAGRFKKKDIYDCGKPRCSICHGGIKYPKRIKTRMEVLFLRSFKEQMQDL